MQVFFGERGDTAGAAAYSRIAREEPERITWGRGILARLRRDLSPLRSTVARAYRGLRPTRDVMPCPCSAPASMLSQTRKASKDQGRLRSNEP